MARDGAEIRFLHATFVPEDEAAYCVFAAASVEVVETAYRRANVPFERIVDALELNSNTVAPTAETTP